MPIFSESDILLPKDIDFTRWAVIACDQFTSQPEYWAETENTAAGSPSALHLIFPEAKLSEAPAQRACRIEGIHDNMRKYLESGLFCEYPESYIYVERTLLNGSVRRGVIGKLDLEEYDYADDASAAVRATEKTVPERIPPRMEIREGAAIELPHVIVLCDDEKRACIEYLSEIRQNLPLLYDFDLMQGGGHIRGYLVKGKQAEQFENRLQIYMASVKRKYKSQGQSPLYFAVGDGNHSLATAKSCYEVAKRKGVSPDTLLKMRYALIELENIHDDAQQFEPIHRIVSGADISELLANARKRIGRVVGSGCPIQWYAGEDSGILMLDTNSGELPTAILQNILDDFLAEHEGSIDYIHDTDSLKQLSRMERTIGFVLPPICKNHFFEGIVSGGALPRKTFSMGHAREKRYYLEARKIL